jgi:DNA-binding GntR family transcriptional regulator
MRTVNRKSKLPLYQQIHDILREDIVRQRWKPGDTLPPESELVDRYAVSTVTIRQALEVLTNEGLIYRQRGRGTFVAHPTLEQNLTRLISFTEDMRTRGFHPTSQVLSSTLVKAPPDIAESLQIAPGEELAVLERLRLADAEPMSIEESYLVHRYCPGILGRHDYSTHSLREALEQDYGIRTTRAKQAIRAIAASRGLARILSVTPKEPLLFIERVTEAQLGMPVEFLRIYYRGDRYTLHNDLQG